MHEHIKRDFCKNLFPIHCMNHICKNYVQIAKQKKMKFNNINMNFIIIIKNRRCSIDLFLTSLVPRFSTLQTSTTLSPALAVRLVSVSINFGIGYLPETP